MLQGAWHCVWAIWATWNRGAGVKAALPRGIIRHVAISGRLIVRLIDGEGREGENEREREGGEERRGEKRREDKRREARGEEKRRVELKKKRREENKKRRESVIPREHFSCSVTGLMDTHAIQARSRPRS